MLHHSIWLLKPFCLAFSLAFRLRSSLYGGCRRIESLDLSIRFTEEGVKIICPLNVDFSLPEVQRLVRNAIIRAMKKNAQEYLPPLLSALSEQYHLPFKRVKITGSKGRWGSCSGTGSINLSCYLMLLPPHLMDYVLLHELSHTKEMNHGPRFWELLDSMTGGRARALRAELRRFNTDF